MALTDTISQQPTYSAICAHRDCQEMISDPRNKPGSHHLSFGLQHFKYENGQHVRSYMQIYATPFTCSRDHAIAAGHARIDAVGQLTHGSYDPVQHPAEADYEFPASSRELHKSWSVYHPSPTPLTLLPKQCAICNADTSREVWIPNVDDASRGTHYQGILRKQFPNATDAQLTLGACSKEHALELAHRIVDEIIQPDYLANQAAKEQ